MVGDALTKGLSDRKPGVSAKKSPAVVRSKIFHFKIFF